MIALFFILLVGFEVKHYVADYFLQPAWMLGGKGDFHQLGGYAHAGVHVALSAVVLLLAGTPPLTLGLLAIAEYVVHYALDYAKIHYSRGVRINTSPRRFWALHGVDQLTHQLTYAAMIYVVLDAEGVL